MIDAKIGDKIYLTRGGSYSIIRIETVTRITPTLIKSENYSYRKEDLRIRGQDNIWFQIYASLETPKLKEQWREQELRNWMERNYKRISLDYIEQAKAQLELEKNNE